MAQNGRHCPLWVWGSTSILSCDRGQSCDAFQAIQLEETTRCNKWLGFRSGVLRGIWINASAHKTWRHLYFFLICFPYQVIYQKTCQILGFLNIHELGISWNTNLNKRGRIHDIWDKFWPQNVLFQPFSPPQRSYSREISPLFLSVFMPPDRLIGGILFLSSLSVCLFVCLSVCLSVCCQL